MREILYKNETSLKNRRRVIFVSEKSENKNALTRIHKVFIYVVAKEVEAVDEITAPIFSIIKQYNSKTKEEKFSFRVKGTFYIVKENKFLMVHFCHSLRIDITPKVIVSAH